MRKIDTGCGGGCIFAASAGKNRHTEEKGKKDKQMKKAGKARLALIVGALTLLIIVATTVAVGASDLGPGADAIAKQGRMIKSGLTGQRMTFSDVDFKCALGITDFDTVTVTRLPESTEGTLVLSGKRVREGQVIRRRSIAALSFIPATAEVTEAGFAFTVTGGGAGCVTECRLRFLDRVNYAPKGADATEASLSLRAQSGVALYGKMVGTDPEGDKIEFIAVESPRYGSLTVTDAGCGEYRYTPSPEYVGEDSFGYVVRDEFGNYSGVCRVNINVGVRDYSGVLLDMEGRREYGAALTLCGAGVTSGVLIGGNEYFLPEQYVSRAEFVAMALSAAGIKEDSSIAHSFFDDDAEIPAHLRRAVATAQRVGVINGEFSDGKLLFRPNDTVTRADAAEILSALCSSAKAEAGEDTAAMADVPLRIRRAMSGMYSLGIFERGDKVEPGEKLNRATVAVCLARAMNVIGG